MRESSKQKIAATLRTLTQAIFVWLISSLPWLGASMWQAWTSRDVLPQKDFFDFVGQNLSAGEAFLYVSAFVAPFFWVITSYQSAGKRISLFPMWLLLSIVAIVGSAWLFAVHRVSPDGAVAQIPYVGIAFYLLGFAIWVRSLYADNILNLPEVEEPYEATRRRVGAISRHLGGNR